MSRFSVMLWLGICCAGGAVAQPSLGTAAASRGQWHRLTAEASYTEGCFEPCRCPIFFVEPLRGVFFLQPAPAIAAGTQRYLVNDLFFVAGSEAGMFRISGHGEYTVSRESMARPTQRLKLALRGRDGESKLFDSGVVPLDPTGAGIDVLVSMNGLFCHDIAIRIAALPVRPVELRPYALERGSTFQQGCYGACDCLLEQERPLSGGLALIPLGVEDWFDEYAVVNVAWQTGPSATPVNTVRPLRIRGVGFYRAGGSGIVPQEQMLLELAVGGDAPTKFDSGLVNGGEIFPRIDVDLSMNQLQCYDRLLHIIAAPSPMIDAAARLSAAAAAGAEAAGP